MDQSKLKANTCRSRQARENGFKRVAIILVLLLSGSIKWRELSSNYIRYSSQVYSKYPISTYPNNINTLFRKQEIKPSINTLGQGFIRKLNNNSIRLANSFECDGDTLSRQNLICLINNGKKNHLRNTTLIWKKILKT